MPTSHPEFRVLFLYPNIQMRTIAPPGIAQMAAVLKEHGFACEVFDCTRYESTYINPERDYDASHDQFLRMNPHSDRAQNSNVVQTDWSERGIQLRTTDMGDDFRKKLESFDPHLVCVSLVENTFCLGMDLIELVPDPIPVICGGVFASYAPQIVIGNPRVDYVCRGEGEYPLLDLCRALARGRPTLEIPNLWIREGDRVIRNPMRPPLDLDALPPPDYSLFETSLLFTPMQGRIWKAIGFETQRGCPYTCTYCNSPANSEVYASEAKGRFYRRKSVPRLKADLDHLVRTYDPELIYFVADTFLAMSRRELDEFSEFYQSYRIPFWMNTRAETISAHSALHLQKMNCLRFNIGIEHGNPDFRSRVLRRKVSNEATIRAFETAAEYDSEYTCVANSIIGLPTETLDLAFDTIELNRALPPETVAAGAFIFAPFHGTPLRGLAIEKGYISPDLICTHSSNTTPRTLLRMPEFPPEQIEGLMRTFSFYVKFPRDSWPRIDLARTRSGEGERVFEELRREYAERYLDPSAESVAKKLRHGEIPRGSSKIRSSRFVDLA
ncbi:MAG: B12-binding domain-containing radical SAM protein [Myxococcota bacterium]